MTALVVDLDLAKALQKGPLPPEKLEEIEKTVLQPPRAWHGEKLQKFLSNLTIQTKDKE